jgi:dTDP-4-dehydrorhamnose 3,5-epimerase
MRFVPTRLGGAYVVELELHEDERGFFARSWCRDELVEHGLNGDLAQCSISRNLRAGTLRGLHFQLPPHEEAKLVRCVRGGIFDVIVDLRPESPTRTEWFGVELDAERGTALYVPEGFAHGFQTLVDDTDVYYSISTPYAPGSAAGVRWDDPAFGIVWPEAATRVISARDRGWPDFEADMRTS